MIAQSVKDVVPEAVGKTRDGKYLGVEYGPLLALLVAGLNEERAEMNASFSGVLSKLELRYASLKTLLQTSERLEMEQALLHSQMDEAHNSLMKLLKIE